MNEEQEKYICENPKCGKEHDGSYGSGRFCSAKCKNAYNLSKASKEKQLEHLRKLHASRRYKHGTWICPICNNVFESRRLLKKHEYSEHPQFYNGQRNGGGWAKGLTKETDPRIKWGKTLSEKIAKGEIIPTWKGRKHTEEEKRHLSLIQSENAANGKIMGTRKDVKFYSFKNLLNEEFLLRGTWELNVAKHLNELGILWTRNRKIEYLDSKGTIHVYNPDFFLPNTNEYIEVKGLFPEGDKIKMDLVTSQHPEKRIYFIYKKNYKQFIKGIIFLSDDMLYCSLP